MIPPMSGSPVLPQALLGSVVVLDTQSSWLYIGRLSACDGDFVVLEDADARDGTDGHCSKEIYLLDVRKHGVRKNRDRVFVRLSEVVAISRLEDVTVY